MTGPHSNIASVTTTGNDILMTSPFAMQGPFATKSPQTGTASLLSNILQGDNCDDWTNMDCDDDVDGGLHHHRLVRGSGGMASNDSTGSLTSVSSASSTPEYEPELSQSFGSTKSYDLMTPSKPPGLTPDTLHSYSFSKGFISDSHRYAQSANADTAQHLSQQRHNLGEMLGLKLDTATVSDNLTTASAANTATMRSKRPTAPGLAGRLKINLPQSASINASNIPQTPGGHIAQGARDGAATGGVPVSPFEPPTPVYMSMDSPFAPQSGLPATPSPPTAQRPKLQQRHTVTPLRHNSSSVLGMSPITTQFAAVSMRKASSSKEERIAPTSTSPKSQSPTSTLLTPPYSPFSGCKALPTELEIPSASMERKLSTSSSSSNGSTRNVVRSAVSSRQKASKSKASPYPLPREESPVKGSVVPSSAPSSAYFANGVQKGESPSAPPSLLKNLVKPPMAATPMEKCVSEPVPKTVSAKHLAHRILHPTFAANYTLGDELGSGGFGFVVSATRNRDGMPVAVKFIWKEKVPSHGWVRDDEFGAIPMEAFVLKVVDSPFVVKFIDLFDDDQFFYLVMEHHGSPWKAPSAGGDKKEDKVVKSDPLAFPSSTAMQMSKSQPNAAPVTSITSPTVAVFPPESDVPVLQDSPESSPASTPSSSSSEMLSTPAPRPAAMERRSSCDLFECIEQHARLGEDKARWVFAQIVEAVYYLDKRGICHRDIKDENCVIDSDFNIKLIDFGSAVITDPRRPTPYFNRFFGTMTFASSEILQGKQYRAPHAEVWSLGVLLSILLSGECPFADPTAAIRGKISRPSSMFSSEAQNLLMACLVVNPDKRATIGQIRQHPWVTKAWQQRGQSRPGEADLSSLSRSA